MKQGIKLELKAKPIKEKLRETNKPEGFPPGWRWEMEKTGIGRLKMPGRGEFFKYKIVGRDDEYGKHLLYQYAAGENIMRFSGSEAEFKLYAEDVMHRVLTENDAQKQVKNIACLCGIIGQDAKAFDCLGLIVKAKREGDTLVLQKNGIEVFRLTTVLKYQLWNGALVVHSADASYVFALKGKEVE